jgi:pyruvate dehydrogenase E2 component (dihydrolipoamide acetyltransferase)
MRFQPATIAGMSLSAPQAAGLDLPVPAPRSQGGEVAVQELTRLQQVVARRMAEAKATVPEFQVQTEVAMDAALALRAQLKAQGGDVVPSVNDFVVKRSSASAPAARCSHRWTGRSSSAT